MANTEDTSSELDLAADWNCGVCRRANAPTRKKCQVCGTSRAYRKGETGSADSKKTKGTEAASSGAQFAPTSAQAANSGRASSSTGRSLSLFAKKDAPTQPKTDAGKDAKLRSASAWPKPAERATDSPQGDDADWSCGVCNRSNKAGKVKCGVCGTKRGYHKVGKVLDQGDSKSRVASVESSRQGSRVEQTPSQLQETKLETPQKDPCVVEATSGPPQEDTQGSNSGGRESHASMPNASGDDEMPSSYKGSPATAPDVSDPVVPRDSPKASPRTGIPGIPEAVPPFESARSARSIEQVRVDVANSPPETERNIPQEVDGNCPSQLAPEDGSIWPRPFELNDLTVVHVPAALDAVDVCTVLAADTGLNSQRGDASATTAATGSPSGPTDVVLSPTSGRADPSREGRTGKIRFFEAEETEMQALKAKLEMAETHMQSQTSEIERLKQALGSEQKRNAENQTDAAMNQLVSERMRPSPTNLQRDILLDVKCQLDRHLQWVGEMRNWEVDQAEVTAERLLRLECQVQEEHETAAQREVCIQAQGAELRQLRLVVEELRQASEGKCPELSHPPKDPKFFQDRVSTQSESVEWQLHKQRQELRQNWDEMHSQQAEITRFAETQKRQSAIFQDNLARQYHESHCQLAACQAELKQATNEFALAAMKYRCEEQSIQLQDRKSSTKCCSRSKKDLRVADKCCNDQEHWRDQAVALEAQLQQQALELQWQHRREELKQTGKVRTDRCGGKYSGGECAGTKLCGNDRDWNALMDKQISCLRFSDEQGTQVAEPNPADDGMGNVSSYRGEACDTRFRGYAHVRREPSRGAGPGKCAVGGENVPGCGSERISGSTRLLNNSRGDGDGSKRSNCRPVSACRSTGSRGLAISTCMVVSEQPTLSSLPGQCEQPDERRLRCKRLSRPTTAPNCGNSGVPNYSEAARRPLGARASETWARHASNGGFHTDIVAK